VALLLTILSLAAATFAFSRAPAGASDVERYVRAHRAAVKYRRQRDDLQRRLTVRVLQVGRLRRVAGINRDVSYAIRLASAAYGVPLSEMHSVASCESGHDPSAQNGIYRSVFQEGPMFERGPFGRAGFSVWDPVANAMTAAWTVSREGWLQWSCKP
jgi:hypothetical protein